MARPDFNEIKTFEEFSKYYWYREELIKICRSLGLKSAGGKIELNKVIEAYFNCEKILPERPRSCAANGLTTLSLNTSLLACNFTFGPRFREFFEKQTGIKPFKFNVDMVASVKKIKETGDSDFTLGDLLDIYYGKKTYVKYDNSALQWNRFVKDFYADKTTEVFSERLKTAAALWRIVRESDKPKVYSHELLEIHHDFLCNYK